MAKYRLVDEKGKKLRTFDPLEFIVLLVQCSSWAASSSLVRNSGRRSGSSLARFFWRMYNWFQSGRAMAPRWGCLARAAKVTQLGP